MTNKITFYESIITAKRNKKMPPEKNKKQPRQRALRAGIAFDRPGLAAAAAGLARQLELPLVPLVADGLDFVLFRTAVRLELRWTGDIALAAPVWVEFVNGPAGYRRRRGGREMLIRAIGVKQGRPLSIIDATGGMGRDAFLLAGCGCTVHIFERHPVVAALLRDGLRRAAENPATRESAGRTRLVAADSRKSLENMTNMEKNIDVVYLDPMFPGRTKSALVKKELQILQLLVGQDDDNDTEQLLAAALNAARNRVVVKRPKSAPPLAGPKPSHCLSGTTTRFDVYMTMTPKTAAGP